MSATNIIPFNHKPWQRNKEQVREEILSYIPNPGDTGTIRTSDVFEARLIENFFSFWSKPPFKWKRKDEYMNITFTLTRTETMNRAQPAKARRLRGHD